MIKGRYACVFTSFVDRSGIKSACIEVSILNGLPTIEIVGLCDSSIRESKQRIRSALRHSGLQFPAARVVISISPAYIKKSGSSFDLPIAIGILMASGQINTRIDSVAAMGELSLTGCIKDTPGTIARLHAYQNEINKIVILPAEAKAQADLLGVKSFGAGHIKDVVDYLISGRVPECQIMTSSTNSEKNIETDNVNSYLDFSILKGQEKAGRAILLAASGFHNTLLTGSPGSGKTIAAQIIRGILPPLDIEEKVHMLGVVGCNALLSDADIRCEQRPFVKIPPTSTLTDIHGKSNLPYSGALARSVHGVLFLDELAEFSPRVLDSLRTIMEEKHSQADQIEKRNWNNHRFLFVGAMNPCRCGEVLDAPSKCSCSVVARKQYLHKISGAILDRIDIFCQMYKINRNAMIQSIKSENFNESISIRNRVWACWEMQKERNSDYIRDKKLYLNGELMCENWQDVFRIPTQVMEYSADAGQKLGLSARGINRIIRVARTIADIEESIDISNGHVSEAFQYRMNGFNSNSKYN